MKAENKTQKAKDAKIQDLKPGQQKAVKGGLNFTKITYNH